MSWVTDLVLKASPPFIINDSKTPSGRAHVGALRGVLIHDSVHREVREADPSALYMFGSDDYDALDELPHGLEEFYREYLGVPLCNVPPPPGSDASDIADYYISEFFALFGPLDVSARTYRMRDMYRTGRMDSAIDAVLRGRKIVREIYQRVNGSVKPEEWHPFQVICPSCGKIGTTIVVDYDGRQVRYECRKDLVSWAAGCGSAGWVNPFGGGGKLPWKLEWAARWGVLGVTIEGAGKDHTTRGGSRDVANAVAREVLRITPPLNLPYEFFLVGGSKMSSSRGVGAGAADIAALLPPQLLRFLLVRTPPRRALNFTPDLESISRLYSDYDRVLAEIESGAPSVTAKEHFFLTRVSGEHDETARVGKILPWDTVVSLIQLPHIDFWEQADARFDPPLSPAERTQLGRRVESARIWLKSYASPEERVEIRDDNLVSINLFSNTQRAFLSISGSVLQSTRWVPDAVQASLFDAARLTPIAQQTAFETIYRFFLGRAAGPRAGNLLAFLDREYVVSRLTAVRYSRRELIEETAAEPEWVISELASRASRAHRIQLNPELTTVLVENDCPSQDYINGIGVANVTIFTAEGRREIARAILSKFEGYGSNPAVEEEVFLECFDEFVILVRAATNLPLNVVGR